MITTVPKHKHTDVQTPYKEVWLTNALEQFIRKHFATAGYEVPNGVRVSTGWPSCGAFSKVRRVGEAWNSECSEDGTCEVIISLFLDDPIKILGVFIHEIVHITVGIECGHKKPFRDCMKAVGLNGKPTATGESDELVTELQKWVEKLGVYPHAKLDSLDRKKQSTRLLKLECKCGCNVRVTRKWLDKYGDPWVCPCGSDLVLQD